MSVDKGTVKHVAKLARLAVTDEEADKLTTELNGILAFVDELAEVDVTDVPPMTAVVATAMKMREDKVTDGERVEDVLSNAPDSEDGYYLVPKVVE
ncbi:Asp-tRNA(Asn)/Glu-tRNA(Gln) amidotransferase subunit GatC [Amorphus orientalis]|uniref:Aspartyl/glutamyl-tRNA(Asn/Gln) amidotransferase subunit C n=1 Tax=Amorphus orientalis TaxID=649198 RepID=A0AAE3VMF5_9HYPH|nr:Asp-tRNA(Asn)/Glu-tRNA(Gln) amidotransferase subunit GatC [Amorphus orientalis]MDQ0314731.1 aspartyl-tRNA(Asn)/glutamyl-tRNA(Gln) amidotransferase subunit C [Amorphus orientalis]